MSYIIQILPQILEGLGVTMGTFAVTIVLSIQSGR